MEKEWEAEALEAWERLSIQDNFIFQRVMQNVKLCKWLLERILKVKIREIRYSDTEKSIGIRLDSKAVRLDVYVEDEIGTVYNIEMQTTKGRDGELPRRTRYYQGMIDMDLLGKGVYYDDLRQSYIIFICTFDLFGLDERIYTFCNRCMEQPEFELGDGTTKIFLNANDAPSPSLRGGSAMLEAGYRFAPKDSRFSYDLRFTGWQGKRHGYTGGAHVNWAF